MPTPAERSTHQLRLLTKPRRRRSIVVANPRSSPIPQQQSHQHQSPCYPKGFLHRHRLNTQYNSLVSVVLLFCRRIQAADGFFDDRRPRSTSSAVYVSETKLFVSNLDYSVNNSDIKGRAEVVYSRQTDAEAGMKKYNNFKFRGKYTKVKIVGHLYNCRFFNHATYRPVPYAPPKIQAPDAVRGHGLIADQAAPSTTSSAIETEAKLFISHLDHEISYKDIELILNYSRTSRISPKDDTRVNSELISEVGGWKKYSLHCDESGESRVRAEVVYSRRKDAEEAMEKYNNVELDGKPMKIKIVGGNVSTPVHLPASVAVGLLELDDKVNDDKEGTVVK